MLELVSVHIPKCGGTSLARILARRYGWRLHLEYGPPEHPWHWRVAAMLMKSLRNSLPPRAIQGHFPASKYKGKDLIVVIRDPVEIRLSIYHYIRKVHAQYGIVANDHWQDAISLDVPEFLSLPFGDLSDYLDLPCEEFSFVGRLERFDEDMRRLCDWLEVQYTPVRLNANARADYDIPDDWRRQYEAANAAEVELYHRFLEKAA